MKFSVQQEAGSWPSRYGPANEPHPLAADLRGCFVTLERGSQPTMLVLGVSGGDDVVCFCRMITGPAQRTTAWFSLGLLGPSDYTPDLPYDRSSRG